MNIKYYFEKYEGRIGALALIVGFIVDNLTLRRIDFFLENLSIVIYLLLAGIGIIVLNLIAKNAIENGFLYKLKPWCMILIQFAFGGLFSSFTVFYIRSSSLASNWLFILILGILLIGSEVAKKRYSKFTFQISVYFIALFLFAIFLVPVILGMITVWTFLLSGVVTLFVFGIFSYCTCKIVGIGSVAIKRSLYISVGFIFITINILYFANIIPPIPLSLKDVGVYHVVTSVEGGGYKVSSELQQKSFFSFFNKEEIVHIRRGEPVYVFSSVFAPTKLTTKIIHNWQFYDSLNGEWVSQSKINFPISGGRDQGYRGYTFKTNISPGSWRVIIETERGQRIGQIKFDILDVEKTPELIHTSL